MKAYRNMIIGFTAIITIIVMIVISMLTIIHIEIKDIDSIAKDFFYRMLFYTFVVSFSVYIIYGIYHDYLIPLWESFGKRIFKID